jgi:DNA-binding CsgD family transcriptional regulator
MGRQPAEQSTPELFPNDRVRDASPPQPKPSTPKATPESAPQRHILPKNLRSAVKHLSDGELDLMHAATLEEMKRRGRLPPGVETDLRPLGHRLNVRPDLPLKRTSARNQPQRRPADIAEESLTRGQLNAVRAALKAGITPARIARQFGISQSNVRKALASHDPKR